MSKVKVIISTIRYGSNGYKHMGDEFNLPDALAKEKEGKGLVKIITDTKEEKTSILTKDLKDINLTK